MNIQKALVIDDSKVAHLTLRKLLVEQGIDVDWVGSGEDGIAYLKRQRPDVVFMDIMMPGMDGFETTSVINSDAAIVAPPIVMCSANATDNDRHNAKQNGAIAFLSKPYTADELDQILDQVRGLSAPPAALPNLSVGEQPTALQSGYSTAVASDESQLIAKAVEKAEETARNVAAEIARDTAEQVVRSALHKTGRAVQEALKDGAMKAARTTAEEAACVVAERVAREVSENVAAQAIHAVSQASSTRHDLDEIRQGLIKDLEAQFSYHLQDALASIMAGGEFRQRLLPIVQESVLATLVEPAARQAAAQTAQEVVIQALAEAAPPRTEETAGQAAGRHAKLALAAGFAAVIISVVVGILF